MDKVSIIIPIYKVEKYLRQCLDSIINQTYKYIEIILIDDGSPDHCGEICDEYASHDDRIIVIHKTNSGVSAARNDGIEIATGELIMFVDPDDWIELDCCERIICSVKNRDCDVLYFQRDDRNDNGVLLQTYPKRISGFLREKELQDIRLSICKGDTVSAGFESATPWGKLYRRTFLTGNNCRFPVGIKKRQDIIFNLICLNNLKSAYYLDYIGYHYRHNSDSICHRYNPDVIKIMIDFLNKLKEYIMEKCGGDSKYEKAFGEHILLCLKDIEAACCFHPSGFVTFRTYEKVLDYFFSSIDAEYYFRKCKALDMNSPQNCISFYLLSVQRRWRIYYYLKYIKCKFSSDKKRNEVAA